MAMAESDTGDVRENSRKIDKEKRQTALLAVWRILYDMLYDCADYLRLIARVRVYNFSLVGHWFF